MDVEAVTPSALDSTSSREFDWFGTNGFADPGWIFPGMDGEILTDDHIELNL